MSDTLEEVLGYVQYNGEDLTERLRKQTEVALQSQQMTIEESQKLLQNYAHSLRGYTYLSV